MLIHNTLTGDKQPLRPLVPGKVRMYVCGATVYDLCHVGHARVFVVFDVVVRYLRHLGLDVHYVRNITDIDDKIIRRAAENGETTTALTERTIAAMHEDLARLGVLPPDDEPRASGHIGAIIGMVETLIAKGYAYAAPNGDVYYAVQRFERYGRLSHRVIEELRAGERVEVNEAKADPLDFALWKAAKPGEPAWPSPWGDGRPGWHIECSAMSTQCLGNHFDIHGGGYDLIFPHHENEIAQSEAATGEPYVNVWMHNGFVRIDDEKMSKSLGNFFTIRDVLARYQPEVLRFFLLGSHYRSALNYSDAALDAAREGLTRFYLALDRAGAGADSAPDGEFVARFDAAMQDDFNTPGAIAVLFELVRELNRAEAPGRVATLAATLRHLGGVLGLLQDDPQAFLKGGAAGEGPSDADIDALVQARLDARNARDFARADAIRAELTDAGIVLEDGAGGTTWRRR
ncbi:MAG: cysteine--tRNA ligase [Immundisolibacter sp.]|uniref:cysteine--tRNA ligase n=1 Tax=Immundisolibacter sp. TaxID=1934948 RepID=UPI003D0ECB89